MHKSDKNSAVRTSPLRKDVDSEISNLSDDDVVSVSSGTGSKVDETPVE